MTINWNETVMKRKEDILQETQAFLQIESVLDESSKETGAPFGQGVKEALEYMLNKGNEDGFQTKNVDGYAGHIEFGTGEELLGILCHVDVVPAGDGWSSDPYSAEIRDGKIYARGAIDDKGPTMAAYYAMKIVKDLGVPVNKRVRMIIGTDEESDWRCVEHYFKHEEMPSLGFAPDADFPIIFAEKGIADVKLSMKATSSSVESSSLKLFEAGRRLNMVPDDARAVVKIDNMTECKEKFEHYLELKKVNGKAILKDNELHMQVEGVSAHGSEPTKGRNAGLLLAEFLGTVQLDEQAEHFIGFIDNYLVDDSEGLKLGIAASDDVSGALTVNAGLLHYKDTEGWEIGLNIRYPVKHDFNEINKQLLSVGNIQQIQLQIIDHSTPHYVPKETEWLRTLQDVYEEQTGEKGELISTGGGTYARVLENGVAFGPLFPGREDVIHQKDEYIWIEDLLKATAIYAQAIYELVKE